MNPIPLILQAATFAAGKHASQRRKNASKTPYINHPLAVAHLLNDIGMVSDPELLAAAILHDTVEDTDTSFTEIEQRFGMTVCGYVREVTDDKSLEKKERKRLQIETAPKKSAGAKQLKLADKICNVRDLDNKSPKGWDLPRKKEYLDWAEQVCQGLKGINEPLDQLFERELESARERIRH